MLILQRHILQCPGCHVGIESQVKCKLGRCALEFQLLPVMFLLIHLLVGYFLTNWQNSIYMSCQLVRRGRITPDLTAVYLQQQGNKSKHPDSLFVPGSAVIRQSDQMTQTPYLQFSNTWPRGREIYGDCRPCGSFVIGPNFLPQINLAYGI